MHGGFLELMIAEMRLAGLEAGGRPDAGAGRTWNPPAGRLRYDREDGRWDQRNLTSAFYEWRVGLRQTG